MSEQGRVHLRMALPMAEDVLCGLDFYQDQDIKG